MTQCSAWGPILFHMLRDVASAESRILVVETLICNPSISDQYNFAYFGQTTMARAGLYFLCGLNALPGPTLVAKF